MIRVEEVPSGCRSCLMSPALAITLKRNTNRKLAVLTPNSVAVVPKPMLAAFGLDGAVAQDSLQHEGASPNFRLFRNLATSIHLYMAPAAVERRILKAGASCKRDSAMPSTPQRKPLYVNY